MRNERIRNFALGLVFGFFALALESTLFPALFKERVQPSLLFGMILGLGFFKTNPDGVVLSFLFAYLEGALSGTLSGIFIFAGMSLYLVCFFLRSRFAPRSALGQFGFAFALGIFYKLVLLLALELFVGRFFFRAQSPGYFILEALLNAVLAVLVLALFRRAKGFFDLIPEEVEPRRG